VSRHRYLKPISVNKPFPLAEKKMARDFNVPENTEHVNREVAAGEHDDDSHQHLGGLPAGPQLTFNRYVRVGVEGVASAG